MEQGMKWEFKINSKRKESSSYEKIVEYVLRERERLFVFILLTSVFALMLLKLFFFFFLSSIAEMNLSHLCLPWLLSL